MYKGRPPDGGRRGFEIVDEDMGGGGFWENGCPLFRTFQSIIVSKIYVTLLKLKMELLPFMGRQSSINGETCLQIFQAQLRESEIMCQ